MMSEVSDGIPAVTFPVGMSSVRAFTSTRSSCPRPGARGAHNVEEGAMLNTGCFLSKEDRCGEQRSFREFQGMSSVSRVFQGMFRVFREFQKRVDIFLEHFKKWLLESKWLGVFRNRLGYPTCTAIGRARPFRAPSVPLKSP